MSKVGYDLGVSGLRMKREIRAEPISWRDLSISSVEKFKNSGIDSEMMNAKTFLMHVEEN